ncbi:hypothetical protein ACFE04_008653 [Oxalis oulophora]
MRTPFTSIFKLPHCSRISLFKKNSKNLSNPEANDGFRIPAFVPKIYRFSCGAEGITRIEDHQKEKHPGNDILVVKLRALETDENAENEVRFSALKTDESNVSSSVRWRCNLCKHSPLPRENLMKSHCQSSHGVPDQYKCSMCSFSADEEEIVMAHLKSTHSGASQIVVNIYKKIDQEKSSNTPNSSSVPDTSLSMRRQSCDLPNMPVLSGSFSPSNMPGRPRRELTMETKTNSEKTSSPASIDKVPSEEEQDDQNNLLVCLHCMWENRSKSSRLEPHLVEERITHPRTNHDYFQTFTVDESLESRVQRALAHQTSLMKQMAQHPPIIEISDDEDVEVLDSSSPPQILILLGVIAKAIL